MLEARTTAPICGMVALCLSGLGTIASAAHAQPATPPALHPLQIGLSRPPTPADFVGYPSCMIYAAGADTRIRVRAARASAVCRALAKQLSAAGARWSLKPRRLRHILSPICWLADPPGHIELEVVDAAATRSSGQRICANLARAGWVDLNTP